MQKLCIDLCSGLGGFSRAFVDAGWKVITVDNDLKFNPTICADITKINWIEFKEKILNNQIPDILLASPPCERFSIANSHWPRPGIMKAFEILGAVLEAIYYLQPKHYIIENPKGRMRWFLGTPRHTIRLNDLGYKTLKPTDLWSDFDFSVLLPLRNNAISWSKTHLASKRAEMPLGLSQAILEAGEK
jgi:site-specific DNA-cytosine methylase